MPEQSSTSRPGIELRYITSIAFLLHSRRVSFVNLSSGNACSSLLLSTSSFIEFSGRTLNVRIELFDAFSFSSFANAATSSSFKLLSLALSSTRAGIQFQRFFTLPTPTPEMSRVVCSTVHLRRFSTSHPAFFRRWFSRTLSRSSAPKLAASSTLLSSTL